MHTHVHMCAHTRRHTCTHVHTHARTCVTHMQTHIHTHMHTHGTGHSAWRGRMTQSHALADGTCVTYDTNADRPGSSQDPPLLPLRLFLSGNPLNREPPRRSAYKRILPKRRPEGSPLSLCAGTRGVCGPRLVGKSHSRKAHSSNAVLTSMSTPK